MILSLLIGFNLALAQLSTKLTDDKSVDVTVERPTKRIVTDAGAGGYQAFPDVCRLKNGDLYCVFYAGYTHISHSTPKLPKGGRICAIRSHDEGQTWSEPKTIVDTSLDDRDPSIMALPNGNLICNFFTYDQNGACDTCISRSSDGGASWSEPEIIAPGCATSTAIRRLRSGRLLLPIYAVDGNNKRSYTALCISDDKGKNWSHPYRVAMQPGMTLDEMDFYERKDGTLLAVMREVMAGAESKDGGKTWGAPFPLGFPGHCPNLLLTREGVLLLGHRLPKTSLHFSLDEGKTWKGPVLIDDFIGAYPSMVQLKDGRVLCVYYEEGAGSAIRQAIIKVQVNGK